METIIEFLNLALTLQASWNTREEFKSDTVLPAFILPKRYASCGVGV